MNNSSSKSLRLGSSGLRGIVGAGLDPESALNFGSAFATVGSGGRILVGGDGRASFSALEPAAVAGLLGGGAEVYSGGVLTAGMMHYLINRMGFDGGIFISGGHQDSGWNSLVPLGSDGAYFNLLRQRELFDIYQGRRFNYATAGEIKKLMKLDDAELDGYFTHLERRFDTGAIRKCRFKVIADFCNGAGGRFAARWADLFNLELIALNTQVTGLLPHNPEPRPRSGSPIASVIRELNAAAGMVFNTDMSRMELVTDSGEPLSEEMTFPVALDYLLTLEKSPCQVVTNVCTTRTVDDLVKRRGGSLQLVRVGQAPVIDAMKWSGAALGGEGSGGFAADPEIMGFDGFFMATVILEAMAKSGGNLSQLVRKLPRYHIVKRSYECPSQQAYAKLRELRDSFSGAEISELDGLRFDFRDGWVSVRVSRTEQLIRLISEDRYLDVARARAELIMTRLSK